jgi:uncharacterized protein (DUF1810 family)
MEDNTNYIITLINLFPDKHIEHYETALNEINNGKKISHWIWYLIPTPPYIFKGVEKGSDENKKYALRDNGDDSKGEQAAKAYLNYNHNGVNLGENYYNLLNAINDKIKNYKSAKDLLEDDVSKLLSSVILFKKITDGITEDLYKNINEVCSDIIKKLQNDIKDTGGEKDGKKDGNGERKKDGNGERKKDGNGERKKDGNGERKKDGNGDGDGKKDGNGDGDGKKDGNGDGDGKKDGNGERKKDGNGERKKDGNGERKKDGNGDGERKKDGNGERKKDGNGEKDGEVKCFFKHINDEASGEEYKIFVKNKQENDTVFSTILNKNGFNYIIYSDSKNTVLIINVKTEYYSLEIILDKINNICDDIRFIISKDKDDDIINLIFIYNKSVQSIIEQLKDTNTTINAPISYDEYDVIINEIISQEQDVIVDGEDKDEAIKGAIDNYRKKKATDISDKYFNLIWNNNSCYMHSLFVSLFHFNNKYIYDMIRPNDTNLIQGDQTNILSNLIKNLKIIYEKINGLNKKDTEEYTCVDFRRSLQDFHDSYVHNSEKKKKLSDELNNLKDELNKLKAELDNLNATQKDKKQKEVRDKKTQVREKNKEYNDEVKKWTAVYEDPFVLYDELSNKLSFNKIASLRISSKSDITHDIVDSSNNKLLINTEYIKKEIYKDNQIINYINKGKVLIIFIDQSHINSIKYEDTINVENITLKLRSIIFNTGAKINGGHFFAVIKEGKHIYKYDDNKKDASKPHTTNVITLDDEEKLQETDKITGLIYSADTDCSYLNLNASMFYIRPYGVLGKQLLKKKPGETKATEIQNAEYPTADSYAFCDPAGLKYITDVIDVTGADGASKAIYEWLQIKNKSSDKNKINNSFVENVKKGITKETDAKYAEYTTSQNKNVKCIHIVGPDFRTANDKNEDINNAIERLSTAYCNVLIEFILTEAPALRLLPISGEIFAGKFKDIMPQITYESLNLACGMIKSINNDYAKHLCEKELNMCIYDEEDYNKYEDIWYNNIP